MPVGNTRYLLPLLLTLITLLACSGGDAPSSDAPSGDLADAAAVRSAQAGAEGEGTSTSGKSGVAGGTAVAAGETETTPEIEEVGSETDLAHESAQVVQEAKDTVVAAGAKASDAASAADQEVADRASSTVQEGVAVINDTVQGALGSAETPASDASATAATMTRVAAGKEGLEYIGAQKCKMCHKVQHASWSASEHAALDPPLDCESCHGPGSEYKSLKIMKDPEAAKKAGLVYPTSEFCTGACHAEGLEDGMLREAHEHKES